MRKHLVVLLILLLAIPMFGQGTSGRIRFGATLPSTCTPLNGDVFFKTSNPNPGLYTCVATNTWQLSGTGSVLSVGITTDLGFITVGSSPVTSSGNITLNGATLPANRVVATPNGITGPVSARALVGADIPAINLGVTTNGGATGNIPVARFNNGSGASSSTFWRGDGTWQPASGSGGSGNTHITVANNASVGTIINKLAKIDGSGLARTAETTDIGTVIGVVTAGAGTTGSATIDVNGQSSCVYDGAATVGNYVQISATVAGDCHDAGANYPISNQVIGRVGATISVAGIGSLYIFSPEMRPDIAGGGTSTSLAISATNVGVTVPNAEILLFVANSSFILSLTNSTCIAETAATAQTDFGVYVGTATANGTLKATLRYASSGTTCSVVSPSAVGIVSGDVIRIIGPASPDATLANASFNLAASANPTEYDLATMFLGIMTASQKLLIYPANSSFTLALTGSTCAGETAATAQTDFAVWVGTATSNGTQKATLRFAAAGNVCTVVSPVSTSISSGNVIRIIGPSSVDATLNNVTFNLKGSIP